MGDRSQETVSPDTLCGGDRLHNEVACAAVPGPALLGLLMKGCQVGLAGNGGKEGEGCSACTLYTHVLKDAACPAGLYCCGEHPVGALVHATAQPCTMMLLSKQPVVIW